MTLILVYSTDDFAATRIADAFGARCQLCVEGYKEFKAATASAPPRTGPHTW